jgi:hypothetical protein
LPSNGGWASGGGAFNQNTSVTLWATPAIGWRWDGWFEGNNRVSWSQEWTFIATQNRNLQARFVQEQQQVTITTNVSPSDGGWTSGGGTFNQSDWIRLTATPNSGWIFNGWYVGTTLFSFNTTWDFRPADLARSFPSGVLPPNITFEARFVRQENSGIFIDPTPHSFFVAMLTWDTTHANGVSSKLAHASAGLSRADAQANLAESIRLSGWTSNGGGISSGGGNYWAVGSTIHIAAEAHPGYVFDRWVVVSGNISLGDVFSPTTSFVMPNEDVEIRVQVRPR